MTNRVIAILLAAVLLVVGVLVGLIEHADADWWIVLAVIAGTAAVAIVNTREAP